MMTALEKLAAMRRAGMKPSIVWLTWANAEQPKWWRSADPLVEVVVQPRRESMRLDLRPMVGCDVYLIAQESDPLLTQFVKGLQQVASRVTVSIIAALPQTIGHEWNKGAGWREVGANHG